MNVAGLNITELLKGAGAVILAPMLEKQLTPMLPASVAGTKYGRWGVKLGAALGVWYGAKAVFGRRSADVVAIALGSSLVADAVQEFMPTLIPGGPVAGYLPNGMRAYTNRGLRGGRGGLGLVMPGQLTRASMRGIGPGRNVSMGASNVPVFSPQF